MDSHYQKQKKVNSGKLKYIIIVIFFFFIVSGFLAFWSFKDNNQQSTATSKPSSTKNEAINYNPPTSQDKKDVDTTKEKLGQEQTQNTSGTVAGRKNINAVLTSVYIDSEKIYSLAFAGGVVENNGQCAFIFTKGSVTITKTSSAEPDASTTRCNTVEFSKSELATGTWTVVMNYTSSSSQGTSNKLMLEVE